MSWVDKSYMARKGVAKGKSGAMHELNKAVQSDYAYVYGPYAEPVLRVKPRDLIVAKTEDAFGGSIKKESDSPSKKLNFPFLNPQCGPIAVEGAQKGDVLAVRIHSILPRRKQPIGTSRCRMPVTQPGRHCERNPEIPTSGAPKIGFGAVLKTTATFSQIWDGQPIKRVRAMDGVTILHGRR